MKELQIIVPRGKPLPSVAKLEGAFRKAQLRVTMRGALAQFPGSVHWHLKRGRATGTLEVTRWPAQSRLWISVQSGRQGTWTRQAALALKTLLEPLAK